MEEVNLLCSERFFFVEKDIGQMGIKFYKYNGDFASSTSMMEKWFSEFGCGHTITDDSEDSGYSIEVATTETSEKSHDKVLADRRLKVRQVKVVSI